MTNIDSYNKIALQWDENRKNRGIDPIIIDFSKMLPNSSHILDIGCGSGYPIDEYLSSKGFKITGIDPSVNMISLAKAQNLKNANYYVDDLFSFETNDKYDAIIAFDSLFHISLDKQEYIYEKVSSLIKTNGLFLFTHGKVENTVTGNMFGEKFNYASLKKEKVISLLSANNFKIIWLYEDYKNDVTGERDLIILAKKAS